MISRGSDRDRDRDKWWRDPDRLQAIARFLLLAMIGMFTGYTLVSLFGLIIGGVLAFGVVYYFNKVVNGDGFAGFRFKRDTSSGTVILPSTTARIRLRYRCLSCMHIYSNRRECPHCGSRMKQVEF